MGGISCKCGHFMRDRDDKLPYKAYFFRDTDMEIHYEFADKIQSFIDAIKNNKRNEWIDTFFGGSYPSLNVTDGRVVADIITTEQIHLQRVMFQCENCGSIIIEKGDDYHFASFSPDNDNSKGLFNP